MAILDGPERTSPATVRRPASASSSARPTSAGLVGRLETFHHRRRRLDAAWRRPRSRQGNQPCPLPASLPDDASHSPPPAQRSEKAHYALPARICLADGPASETDDP